MPRTHLDRAFSPLVLVSCVWLLAAPAASSYRVEKFEARIGGSTKAITGALISAAFFPAAARPLFGRVFVSEEYHSDRPAVVVIGNSLWRESFGADPGTIGRKIPLNGRDFIVIGVMPSGFAAPKGVDLWIPLPP
jgi:hypothetical protein